MNDGACRSQGDENSGGGALFATMRRMDMGRSAEEIKKDIESGVGKPSGKWYLDLFPGRYLERLKGLLRGSGCRCEETIRFNA